MRTSLLPLALALGCTTTPPPLDVGPAIDAAARDTGVDAPSDTSNAADAFVADAPSMINDAGVPTCDQIYAVGDACAFTGGFCNQTLADGCGSSCFCSLLSQALCSYDDSAACRAHFCPATQPVNGSDADPPPAFTSGDTFGCDYGPTDCPAHCIATGSGTSPTDYEWFCTVPAGPTCPASACPTTLGTTCSWPDDVSCSFAGFDGCRFDCFCGPGGPECEARDCDCPTSLPPGGTDCPAAPYRALCDYTAPTGEAIQCSCGSLIATTWSCSSPSAGCPSSPPSDTCRAGIDPTSCSYLTPPYCGHCGCDETGHWTCSASTCDMCPSGQPANHSACTADQVGQICDYAPGGTSGSHCACIASGMIWSCA